MNTETKTLTAKELALYLGCEVSTPEGKGQLYAINGDYAIITFGIMGSQTEKAFLNEDIAPILRPISDMTEEEKRDIDASEYEGEMVTEYYAEYSESPIAKVSLASHAGVTVYLLGRGFDVFNWIEQGKAIRKV